MEQFQSESPVHCIGLQLRVIYALKWHCASAHLFILNVPKLPLPWALLALQWRSVLMSHFHSIATLILNFFFFFFAFFVMPFLAREWALFIDVGTFQALRSGNEPTKIPAFMKVWGRWGGVLMSYECGYLKISALYPRRSLSCYKGVCSFVTVAGTSSQETT